MTQDSPLQLTEFLTFRLARVQAKLNAQSTRLLKRVSGLSLAQWRIIAVLGNEGVTTSADIGRRAEFDKGLLSRKLKSLVESGFVQSVPHESDGRVQVLSLTKEGQTLHDKTLPHMRARQTALRGLFNEAELAAFYSALSRIENSLEEPQD